MWDPFIQFFRLFDININMPDASSFFRSLLSANAYNIIEFFLIFLICLVLAAATAMEYTYGISSTSASNMMSSITRPITNAATSFANPAAINATTVANTAASVGNVFKGGSNKQKYKVK